eukprot:TRINITY_DN2040_c0_g2_i1.p1 TRINITY_DN2040_c0_g2~~TRINITY_DN2040_c0_g2_i1.p1  ORF type:complete len:725 (+),score=194.54 TRINITY_DN2040_c0_g2_i1:89-2176(+)
MSIDWGNSPRHLDADTEAYLKNMEQPLKNALVDENGAEEVEMLIGAIHEEIKGKQGSAACGRHTNEFLEVVLRHSTNEQLRSFMQSLKPYYVFLMTHRFSSHVMQTALSLMFPIVENEDIEEEEEDADCPSVLRIVNDICDIVNSQWMDVACHDSGSHIMRSLMSILSGLPPPERENKNRKKGRKGKMKGINPLKEFYIKQKEKFGAKSVAARPVPPSFAKQLTRFFEEMLASDRSWTATMLTDKNGNPFLQQMLAARVFNNGEGQKLVDALILFLLGNDSDEEEKNSDGEEKNGLNVERFYECCHDVIASHFIESAIQNCSAGFFSNIIFKPVFQSNPEKVIALVEDQIGNFIIQQVLACLRTSKQYKFFFKKVLKGRMKSMLEGNGAESREGIIWWMLESIRLNKETSGFVDFYPKVLKELASTLMGMVKDARIVAGVDPDTLQKSYLRSQIGAFLLFRQVTEDMDASGDVLNHFAETRHSGALFLRPGACMIFDSAVQAPFEYCKEFVRSMVGMPPEVLGKLARTPYGSRRILEPLIENEHTAIIARNKLVPAFKGMLTKLSSDKFGCFVTQKIFTAAAVNKKVLMARELLSNETTLAGNKFGQIVLSFCKIAQFKSQGSDWVTNFERMDRRKKMFKNIISDEKESKSSKHTESKTSRKRKREITSDGKLDLKGVVSMANIKRKKYSKKSRK